MAKRPLTGRDIIKICFPDIRNPGNCDIATIRKWEDDTSDRYQDLEPEEQRSVFMLLASAGATLDEALDAVDGGKTLPTVPFYSDAQYSIKEASSFIDRGIATMNDDIGRIAPYTEDKGDDAKKNEAVQFLRDYGTNMYRQNAQLFARFVVNLVNRNISQRTKTAMATATAASLREWRDFGFGDKGMAAFANAAKDYANFVIRDYMQPGSADKFKDNIFDTMVADAHRATFIFNGKAYQETPAAELIPVFKSIVPDPAKQKALSSWLNQLCTTTFMSPSMGVPYGETGVNAIKLKGAGALANRDMTAGVFKSSLLDTYGHDIVHELQVSPDGKTATITQSMTIDLSSPGSDMYNKISFGQVTISQRLVVDLTAEIPTVTDFNISQAFDW